MGRLIVTNIINYKAYSLKKIDFVIKNVFNRYKNLFLKNINRNANFYENKNCNYYPCLRINV